MKKTVLLLLLFLANIAAFAQHKPIITTGQMFHPADTTRTFGVLEMDKDLCIRKLIDFLGTPTTNTTGIITWNEVRIKGLDKPSRLCIRDGITTDYPSNRSTSWSAFNSEADKQEKLAGLKKDQRRDLKIEVMDEHGQNIVNSNEKETVVRDFLNRAFEKE